jgi:peptidoglycan/xylan/chitin deacetylase (PgdA/CDA1 family)
MNQKSAIQWVFSLIILLFETLSGTCQTNVAISIDDVPNTQKFQSDNFQSLLLDKLDSLNIPIAIFINEGLIYKTDSLARNFELLINWVKNDNTTLGNHTFGHSRYSEVGFDFFETDVERGEFITRELAKKNNKSLHFFRFPYNDLGNDSIQYFKIDSLLQSKKYISTPFTIESSDWMFNHIYEYYLTNSELEKAKEIGELYVSKTLDYFHFFDSLSIEIYGRKVNQIYLCHDNSLNADYLIAIIKRLEEQEFKFISLGQAIEDPIYKQRYQYYKKWGVSWFYRWMSTQEERVKWMKLEPDINNIEFLYNELPNKNIGY